MDPGPPTVQPVLITITSVGGHPKGVDTNQKVANTNQAVPMDRNRLPTNRTWLIPIKAWPVGTENVSLNQERAKWAIGSRRYTRRNWAQGLREGVRFPSRKWAQWPSSETSFGITHPGKWPQAPISGTRVDPSAETVATGPIAQCSCRLPKKRGSRSQSQRSSVSQPKEAHVPLSSALYPHRKGPLVPSRTSLIFPRKKFSLPLDRAL